MSKVAAIEAALATLSVAERERLARLYFSASARRRQRLAERDAAICALAGELPVVTSAGRVLAEALVSRLTRYVATAWRADRTQPAPADPRRALDHRILTLSGARVLSAGAIRRALAGLAAGSKSAAEMSHARADDPIVEKVEGRR